MIDLLIIDQFHNAPDDAARARLLLSYPLGILDKYRQVFAEACALEGFETGRAYLDADYAARWAVRDQHGGLPEDMRSAIAATAERLVEIAKARP